MRVYSEINWQLLFILNENTADFLSRGVYVNAGNKFLTDVYHRQRHYEAG